MKCVSLFNDLMSQVLFVCDFSSTPTQNWMTVLGERSITNLLCIPTAYKRDKAVVVVC